MIIYAILITLFIYLIKFGSGEIHECFTQLQQVIDKYAHAKLQNNLIVTKAHSCLSHACPSADLRDQEIAHEKSNEISCPGCKSYDYKRFHFQLFGNANLGTPLIAQLKDAHTNVLPFRTVGPIRSIRLRAQPNDNFRFAQRFSLIIYLTGRPDQVVEFRFSKYSGYIDHIIPDTTAVPSLKFMATPEEKTIVFVTEYYTP